MKKHKVLKGTTHRRTYNLVRKNMYAICARCYWHPTFWRWCWDNPFVHLEYYEDGKGKPEKMKFKNHPNWKEVSKNKKQWMKKQYFSKRKEFHDGTFIIKYGW